MARDWLKDLGSAFSQVGAGMRKGAEEVRKTVGIGVGSVSIQLSRYDFAPGDKIGGAVVLGLAEPTRANRLVVALIGTRNKTSYDKVGGRTSPTTHAETVYRNERVLDGPRDDYLTGEYEFELVVPTDASAGPQIASDGVVGDVARVVSAFAAGSLTPVSWRVVAFLDIPWKRNVKARVDISVNPK